jgi:uncharacterized protein (DUF1501 family)
VTVRAGLALQRRRLLLGAAAWGASFGAPRLAFAQAATDRRFVFVIQRGAADGLNTLVPTGDPAYAPLRGALAIAREAATPIDAQFALHASLAEVARMHAAGEALFVHAVASAYRERSHFEAQNVLELGGVPHLHKDGWMNRLLGLLPPAQQAAIAIAPAIPKALRGSHEVGSYAASTLPAAPDDLLLRVHQLYADDAQLRAAWQAALQARGVAGGREPPGRRRDDAAHAGSLAASFLARPQGARLAMVETTGWDTHGNQSGALANRLRELDALLAALRDGLGLLWGQTVVLVATEFGRTAAVNGTAGTDHGTGALAMLVGGAVRGARVIADWPGLAPGALFEGRDLRPTLSLEALVAGAAAECFGLEPPQVARVLFPQLREAPLAGLVRAA